MKCLRILLTLAFGALALQSSLAHAEGRCPDGYFPVGGGGAGWEGCAPMGGDEGPAQQAPPRWETRWGAVAVTNGAYGFSHSYENESQAVKEALAQCSNNAGGATCTLKQSYHDQCIALAWGRKGSNSVAAPEVAQAESLALDNCAKRTQDCKIFYSGCSLPERVN